ncbi:MAG: hypothetical protein V4760_06070 [Bdellovibrionota bacterium]
MEGLAPPLKCLLEVQAAIRNGEAIRAGLTRYAQLSSARDEFASVVRSFLFAWERSQPWRHLLEGQSAHRRALLEVFACGLAGQSVASQLDALRIEIEKACDAEIGAYLEMLPLKMLAPLLLFQFPAFLLLMFGPLLRHLIQEINR